jgi:ribulose kinase
MVAEGPRRQGHHSDLQVSHADILHDPGDAWLPTAEDYADLADQHEQEWVQRACEAVAIAVHTAQAHRGELIAVDIDKVSASVAQDFSVSVTVIEEYAERWIVIDRLDTDKQPVGRGTAVALANAAFDGVKEDDIEEVFEQTEILGGRHLIDPGRAYAWCAVV